MKVVTNIDDGPAWFQELILYFAEMLYYLDFYDDEKSFLAFYPQVHHSMYKPVNSSASQLTKIVAIMVQ
jgi:hypothetical protein